MAENIKKLIKIGQKKHIENLHKTGEIFCNTLKFFKDCDKPDARFDRLEGSTKIGQYTELTIFSEKGDIVFSKNKEAGKTYLDKGFVSYFNESASGNIFSCIAITEENEDDFFFEKYIAFDQEFKTFGDCALIIENPKKFINSFKQEIEKEGLEYYYGLVDYYNSKTDQRDLNVFCKEEAYKWQNEFRFFIKNNIKDHKTFSIGSIEKYSQIINLI